MEDKQIVDLYFERSESAISETDKKYGRYCHYIAYRILENDEDAKEIVNDTYLKAWNTIPPNRPDPLKPYVGMLSRQLSLDRHEEYHTQGGNGAPLDVFGTLVLPLEGRRVCRELLELQKGCEGPFGSSRG